MKLEEKTKKKDEQGLIIKKYQQYLKLEKSLSKNTLEAYLTDLEKLLSFLSAEGVEILEISLTDLQRFAAEIRQRKNRIFLRLSFFPMRRAYVYSVCISEHMTMSLLQIKAKNMAMFL